MQPTLASFPVIAIKNVALTAPREARQKEARRIIACSLHKCCQRQLRNFGSAEIDNRSPISMAGDTDGGGGLMIWCGYSME